MCKVSQPGNNAIERGLPFNILWFSIRKPSTTKTNAFPFNVPEVLCLRQKMTCSGVGGMKRLLSSAIDISFPSSVNLRRKLRQTVSSHYRANRNADKNDGLDDKKTVFFFRVRNG